MTDRPLHIAVIVGSNREGRFAPVVARWFVHEASSRADMVFDVIDIAELDLPARHDHGSEETQLLRRRIDAADGYVVITPEYNHSFPASLKHVIDLARAEWQAKPVAFVSYGGMSVGLRAVEQLRQVFAELHVATVRDTVSFHNARDRFGPDGTPRDPRGCGAALAAMLDQLAWWTAALRDARDARPYAA